MHLFSSKTLTSRPHATVNSPAVLNHFLARVGLILLSGLYIRAPRTSSFGCLSSTDLVRLMMASLTQEACLAIGIAAVGFLYMLLVALEASSAAGVFLVLPDCCFPISDRVDPLSSDSGALLPNSGSPQGPHVWIED